MPTASFAVLLLPSALRARTVRRPARRAAHRGRRERARSLKTCLVKGADVSSGLIPVVRKAGKVFLVISISQFDKDFIETSCLGRVWAASVRQRVSRTRAGAHHAFSTGRRHHRHPLAQYVREGRPADAASVACNLPTQFRRRGGTGRRSVEDRGRRSGRAFPRDIADISAQFEAVAAKPGHSYRLDPTRAFFTDAKSFPDNTLLRVSQTWTTDAPDTIDNAPDARSIEVRIDYNIIAAPQDGIAPDCRCAGGYFEQPLIRLRDGSQDDAQCLYAIRWNFRARTPGPTVAAKHPLIYTLNQ